MVSNLVAHSRHRTFPDLWRLALQLYLCLDCKVIPALFLHRVGTSPSSSWAQSVRSYIQGLKTRGGYFIKAEAVCQPPAASLSPNSLQRWLAGMPCPYPELVQPCFPQWPFPLKIQPFKLARDGDVFLVFHRPFIFLISWSAYERLLVEPGWIVRPEYTGDPQYVG